MQSTPSPVPKYRVAVILSSATSLQRGRNCSVCSGYMHRVCEEGQQTLKEKFPNGVLLPLLVVLLFIWQAVKNGDDSVRASEIRARCLNFRHNMLFMVVPRSRRGKIFFVSVKYCVNILLKLV